MSRALDPPELMTVSIDLIDEPEFAMRQSFDPKQMEELVESIRAHGIIQTLALVRNGERFRVAAGHRRSIAARLAGLRAVPANVYPEHTPLEEIIKVEENRQRERVNPADEALYYAKLLVERCGEDVLRLCGLVGQKQSYVETRLNLITGYEAVFHALQDRKINLSVALELNKYTDEGFAQMDLLTAIETGATARYIVQLRTEREKLFEKYPQTPPPPDAGPSYTPAPPPRQACIVCDEGADPWNLTAIYVHNVGPCFKILKRAIGAPGGEES